MMAKKKLSAAQLAALEALQKFEASTVAVASPPPAVQEDEPVTKQGSDDGKVKGAAKKAAKKLSVQEEQTSKPVEAVAVNSSD